jgi:hypothetical protein
MGRLGMGRLGVRDLALGLDLRDLALGLDLGFEGFDSHAEVTDLGDDALDQVDVDHARTCGWSYQQMKAEATSGAT